MKLLSGGLILLLFGAISLSVASPAGPLVQKPAADHHADDSANIWGGQHVSMQVTKSGAELEFDCATGTILEPLPLDTTGSFQLKGTFTHEHGGPVRENEPPSTRDATYSGTIENDTLRLRIEIAGESDQAQEYVLKKGQPGRVRKCR